MKNPDFFIKDLDLSIDPNLEEVDFGVTSIDFEINDEPVYVEEKGHLEAEFALNCTLTCYSSPLQDSSREDEEEVGDFEAEVLTVIKGEEPEFEQYLETWKDEGYKSVAWEFRYHIESGFMTGVLGPIAGLVDNSFRGILPGLTFTGPPEQERELDVERYEGEFLEYLIEKEIERVLDERLEAEEIEDTVEAQVPEGEVSEIHIKIEERILEEIEGDDEFEESIKQVVSQAVSEVTGDSVSISELKLESLDSEEKEPKTQSKT